MEPTFAAGRDLAWRIMRAALNAVDPAEAVRNALRLEGDTLHLGEQRYDLRRYRRILVACAGKAGAPMARAVEDVLGERVSAGWVNVKYGYTELGPGRGRAGAASDPGRAARTRTVRLREA